MPYSACFLFYLMVSDPIVHIKNACRLMKSIFRNYSLFKGDLYCSCGKVHRIKNSWEELKMHSDLNHLRGILCFSFVFEILNTLMLNIWSYD